LRHTFGDLFLDGVGGAYGAHSTATDSLRAGLPVLTVAAPFSQMPEVVAASLLASLAPHLKHILVQPSIRSFITAGTRIASSSFIQHAVRRSLIRSIRQSHTEPHGLFNSQGFTADMERLYKAMWDARGGNGGPCGRRQWGSSAAALHGVCGGGQSQPLFHVFLERE
jgi:predicted O-linked N-acetylglucosamine transferase (SPINDLY family)